MNFFNRAIKNITRRVSKTVLLIITFFVIGNFVIIGLSVSSASESAKTLTRQKMRAVATYSVDYDAVSKYVDTLTDEDEIEEFYNNYPYVSYADVQEVLKDDRVKTANCSTSNTLYVSKDGIDFVHLNNQAEESFSDEDSSYSIPAFFAKGNYYPSTIELEEGTWKVVEGSFYTQEDIENSNKVVLVSQALADTNGIRVGDTIKVSLGTTSWYGDDMGLTDEDMDCELEVIGIYTHSSSITPDTQGYNTMYPYSNPDNMLLMPGSTLYNIYLPIEQKNYDYQVSIGNYDPDETERPSETSLDKIHLYDVTILLNDPLEVDQFVEDYDGKTGEFKKISVDNSEFEKLSRPLDTLSDYAKFIVWIVVINAIVIITLVTALTLKTREYEIGVLLSIGASKIKIVLQFFIELAIVALLGFTLAVGSGSVISRQIGAKLLENQIESSGINEEEDDSSYSYVDIWDDDYSTDISLDDLLEEYDVVVSPLIIAEIYVMGLGIVFISVIIPSVMVMRFNPKKILMNQN